MWYLMIGIILLGFVTAIITYLSNRKRRLTSRGKGTITEQEAGSSEASDCCGQHEVCERDNLLAAAGKKIEYYDDEDLDQYAGTDSNGYEESAIAAFEEVLYTLRTNEVADWLRSLQLRQINLPDQLKDEAFMMIEDQRKVDLF